LKAIKIAVKLITSNFYFVKHRKNSNSVLNFFNDLNTSMISNSMSFLQEASHISGLLNRLNSQQLHEFIILLPKLVIEESSVLYMHLSSFC